MSLFDTEDAFLTKNRLERRQRFKNEENPFRMLGGAMETWNAKNNPEVLRAKQIQSIVKDAPLTSEGMIGIAQKLNQAGFTKEAHEAVNRASQLKPKGKDKIEKWYEGRIEDGRPISTGVAINSPMDKPPQHGKEGYFYTKQMKGKPAPPMSVDFGSKEKVKFALRTWGEANNAAIASRKMIQNADFIDAIMGDMKTGSLTEWKMGLGQFASSLGLPRPEGIDSLEAAYTAMGNMAMAQLDNFPGQISEGERKFVLGIMPKLTQTAEGRKTISDMLRSLSQRDIAKRDMMEKYIRGASPDLIPAEGQTFNEEWEQYTEDNPVFLDVYLNNKEGLATAKDKNGTLFYQTKYGWYDVEKNKYGK